jgi:hypothetical protein
MDDSELDRLFGKDSISDKETLKEDDKAGKGVSAKTKPGKKESGMKEPVDKESGKKPVKKESGEKPDPAAPAEKDEDSEDKKNDLKAGRPEEEKDHSGKTDGDEKEEKTEKETGEKSGKDTEDKVKESPEESGDDSDRAKEKEDAPGEDSGEKKERVPEEKKPSSKPVQKQRTVRKTTPVTDEKITIEDIKEMIPLSGKSILAIVLALAVVIMVVLFLFLPAFRVRNTNVEGNVVLTDQEILKAAGLEYDAHLMSGVSGNIFDILRLDYGKTEQRIKKDNPYIEDIRITVKLPSTVDIRVRERSKVCYIRTPDGYAALDRDGIVLELSSSDLGRNVQPVICGLNVKYAELGKPVKIDNMKDYKKAIIVLGAILAADNASVGGDYSMFENTSEVRILPSGYIFLTIYSPSGNLIQIKLNSTDSIGDDMAWLLYAFNADAFDKVTVDGALDMTGDEYIFDEYD